MDSYQVTYDIIDHSQIEPLRLVVTVTANSSDLARTLAQDHLAHHPILQQLPVQFRTIKFGTPPPDFF